MPKAIVRVKFKAKLQRPAEKGEWTFLRLPTEASKRLPTRAMVSVEGTFGGVAFWTTLFPDGEGGHWMKVESALGKKAKVKPGDTVELEIAPMAKEPEPTVPPDFKKALAAAPPMAMETWNAITAKARRDWCFWIVSAKKEETRTKRKEVAIDKLSKGNRRPCCFDRSGMYDKSLAAPAAAKE
ncbi:MAG: YdeI/OmpD-associated family protein [Trueperaceae bacterium]